MTSAAFVLGLLLMGGGSVGLAGDDSAPEPPATHPAPESPAPPAGDLPVAPGAVTLAGLAAALAAARRRGESGMGDALSLEEPPLVIFVPGHGQPAAADAFADLIAYMGLDEESVRSFDYRWVSGGSDAGDASEDVGIDDAVSALNAYVAGVADEGRSVYMVGFSKGGATVAELVADWDDGRWGPAESVVGAALLDPPIARGPHGAAQSLGRLWGRLPDDGGYQPVQCRFLRFDCSDRRVGLGERAGVEVVVVRNPKAAVTSFGDHPTGLRVYNAPDDGPTIMGQLMRNPLRLPARIAEAHDAVLHDRSVAACVLAEMRSGRCDLPRARQVPRLPGLTKRLGRARMPRKAR